MVTMVTLSVRSGASRANSHGELTKIERLERTGANGRVQPPGFDKLGSLVRARYRPS
jgi:hypothetical protein